ncbi:MAG: dialkylresorcinol condensing enzyme DarA [Flavobacteriaceae bacterium]|nr:dialkylresorcinol condensing enzyme DarA [Flavobacteriaceae bacterium]
MKKVLVIYYTQSGQLLEIAKSITSDLEKEAEVAVSYYQIEMESPFRFPWKKEAFFNIFPETFLQIPAALKTEKIPEIEGEYDLVILAYQVWFLTPAIPVNSFLKNKVSDAVFKDTPVITVIGCRNMWIMAQEKIKTLLWAKKANLVGNIALVDRHVNHISVITISHWMFTGLKTKYLKIFPKPGVASVDIKNAARFGKYILKSLKENNYEQLQPALLREGAVKINPFLVLVDKRANFLFDKWARLIVTKGEKKGGKRLLWIKLFNLYLLFAIWFISPVVYLIYLISYPFSVVKIKKEKKYYAGVKKNL